jgi:acyl carrier protein
MEGPETAQPIAGSMFAAAPLRPARFVHQTGRGPLHAHPVQESTGMNHVATALRRFVKENFLFGQDLVLADEDSLLELGIVDSTGVLELVTFIEDRYRITVEDEELVPENLDSIASLVRFITAKGQYAQVAQ